MEKDSIKTLMQRVEQNLQAGPPQVEAAMKDLNTLTELGIHDPRVLVYQAVALNFAGKPGEAKQFAQTALSISRNIALEAETLLAKLG